MALGFHSIESEDDSSDRVVDKSVPIVIIPKEAEVRPSTIAESIVLKVVDFKTKQCYGLILTKEQVHQIAEATDKLLQ